MPWLLWTALRAGVGKALALSGVIGAATAIADAADEVEGVDQDDPRQFYLGPAQAAIDEKKKTLEAAQAAAAPPLAPPLKKSPPAAPTAPASMATTFGATIGVLGAGLLIVGIAKMMDRE